jgi:acyl carrier protein
MENQNSEIAVTAFVQASNNMDGNESTATKTRSVAVVQAWIAAYIADLLEVDVDKIDVTVPFKSYGLDSSAAIGMTGDLEDWLGQEIDPTVLYDYPTIKGLAQYLGGS